MIRIKWQRPTKLSHITVGKLLKNVLVTSLILASVSPILTFADGGFRAASTSTISSKPDEAIPIKAKKSPHSAKHFSSYKEIRKRYNIYQEDKFDQAWMSSLRRRPLPLIDARAVGVPVDSDSIDQDTYTNDIRYGKFHKVTYEKYGDTIVELSDQERKIINFALTVVFMDAEYVEAYTWDEPVTLERLLKLAANVKYSEDLDRKTRYQTMHVLNRYLYY